MIATTSQRRERAPARIHTIAAALRTLTRCLVCGFAEVHTDEVIERGVLLLAECPRCEHRWTERPAAPALAVAQAEVPAAA
jgi:hypothetical protein